MNKTIITLIFLVCMSCESKEGSNSDNILLPTSTEQVSFTDGFHSDDPAFKSYLTKIIGEYEIIEKNSDHILLKNENLWGAEKYYFYSEKNYIITDVVPYTYWGYSHPSELQSTTEDKLQIEPILVDTRDKYNLAPHMFYFRVYAGSDYTDIFNHIVNVDYPVSIQKYITDIFDNAYKKSHENENKIKQQDSLKKSESEEFIEEINKN